MIRRFKNITSLMLLAVFLLPSIIKFSHHHEHLDCNAENENQYQDYHSKCAVCNFEFSVFSLDYQIIVLQKSLPTVEYLNNYCSLKDSPFSKYSFLLRAPPFIQFQS
jgi:hypothetical protein